MTYVLPSVTDLIFLALLGVLLFTPLSSKLLSDAGTGWHIRTGQQILETHTIPRTDPFSSTMQGKPWFAWEWLYDTVVGGLESVWGLNGVVWLTAAVIAVTFAITFRFLISRGVNLVPALVLTLFAISASTIHFLARPHVLTWLFTLIWFWILDSTERKKSDGRWLFILPGMMLIWVNVHGGFLMGFVLLAIFWVGAARETVLSRETWLADSLVSIGARRRCRDLCVVGLASGVASLINPYGWKLHAHIYGYLTSRFLMSHVEEFQSPNFHDLAPKCFAILVLIAVAIAISSRQRMRLIQFATLLFAIYSGLHASRNIPASSVLLVIAVGPLLAVNKMYRSVGGRDRATLLRRMTVMEQRQKGQVWSLIGMVVTLAVCAMGGRIGSSQMIHAQFNPQRMPVQAVNYLANQRNDRPVLAPDYWGGYLIYRLYPHRRVVVDDRHDLYGEAFLSGYLKWIHAEPGWQEFMNANATGSVLLPRTSAIATVLSMSEEWRSVYADAQAIVFERKVSTANAP